MPKGGLRDDDADDLVSAAMRPARLVSQQRNNETAKPDVGEAGKSAEPGATTEFGGSRLVPTGSDAVDPVVDLVAREPVLNAPRLEEKNIVSVPVVRPVEPRAAVGRPKKETPRLLLRATVKQVNYEWAEQQWRTKFRVDGSRYANMGEFMDELLDVARERALRTG